MAKTAEYCSSETAYQCSEKELCSWASSGGKWTLAAPLQIYVEEAKKRGLTCGVKKETDQANKCSWLDQADADFYDNYYVPQDAKAFGTKIQSLVSNEDVHGIYSLAQDELQNGPSKKFVRNKSFKEIFEDGWMEQVLADNAPCSTVGGRGFTLGKGLIWYDKFNDKWAISSLNGTTFDNPALGWTINKRIVHPSCFNRWDIPGNNLGAFAHYFSTEEFQQFSDNPGLFMGNRISNISLAANLEQCLKRNFDFRNRDGYIWIGEDDGNVWIEETDDIFETQFMYKILQPISAKRCSELAPNIGVNCEKGNLIEVGDYSGGTMGWHMSVGIYGFFDLPNFGPSIVPLKFFDDIDEALNYLDKD